MVKNFRKCKNNCVKVQLGAFNKKNRKPVLDHITCFIFNICPVKTLFAKHAGKAYTAMNFTSCITAKCLLKLNSQLISYFNNILFIMFNEWSFNFYMRVSSFVIQFIQQIQELLRCV